MYPHVNVKYVIMMMESIFAKVTFTLTFLILKDCHYSCLTCDGPNEKDCLSCTTSLKRNLSDGKCLCSARFYDNQVDEECKSCHFSCYFCNGSTA